MLAAGLHPFCGPAEAHQIPASDHLVEAGAAPFVVLGVEALGLDSPPTDLRLMPDGRLLVIAAQQLALGDGVRWKVFHQAPSDSLVPGLGAAVADDGRIYIGTPQGAAQVEFGDDGFWRLALTAPWASSGKSPRQTMDHGSMVTVVGKEWYWHSRTGAIFAWQPGEPAHLAGYATTFEDVFRLGDTVYLSDRANGAVSRLGPDGMDLVKTGGSYSAITCSLQFDQEQLLVGTYGLGLQLFDGRALRNFPAEGALSSGARINDLCVTDGGFFAAAVDNLGIVFFGRDGRTVQVLDRSLDQRLSRIKRLVPAPGGVIWGLLDGGVLRVDFPTRVSLFESLIGAGVTTVHPSRCNGRLWWLADGKAYRGSYNADGRLVQLEVDSPAGLFAHSFSGALGVPVVGTDEGAFYRAESRWVPFAPTVKNLRILDATPADGRWLYGGLNEVGWLQLVNGAVEIAQRIPVPDLPNSYNLPVKDAQGRIWLELDIGKIACVQLEQGRPTARIFSTSDGLLPSWPQIFEFEGSVGVNFADKIFRFDTVRQRFEPEEGFVRQFPGISNIVGRPGLDAQGRVWITSEGAVHVFQKQAGRWSKLPGAITLGFQPYYYTFESDGVVWLHAQHRLVRFDPAMPESTPVPLRAQITHVTLAAGRRVFFAIDRELPPLDFSENSPIVHFVSGGNPFAAPVIFEVKLEGAGTDWVSMGSAGSAAFNHLKEGRYVLHVRPKSGLTVGAEATLAFSIRPPWYRTTLAYLCYVLAALGLLLLAAWLSSWFERRETARLERLVAQRTGELHQSNIQLAGQVEEIRMLTQAIEQSPVAVFLTRPDDTIEFANPQGCTLTGFTLDQLIGRKMRQLRSELVAPATLDELTATVQRGQSWSGQLVNRHQDGRDVQVRSTISPIRSHDGQIRHFLILEEDITRWLADQERSHRLEAQLFQAQKMETIGQLAGGVAHDMNNMLQAIVGFAGLARQPQLGVKEREECVEEIINAAGRAAAVTRQLLMFSRQQPAAMEPTDLAKLLANLLKMLRRLIGETIELEFRAAPETGLVRCDCTQIEQVLINICVNARDAMPQGGRITLATRARALDADFVDLHPWARAGRFVEIVVRDTGIGMDATTREHIFEPFFTTKTKDKGTGLGLSVVYGIIKQHEGFVRVYSEPGKGTEFCIYLPAIATSELAPEPVAPAPAPGGSETILVAEDEPGVRMMVERVLTRAGYRVILTANGEEAVEKFGAHRDEIALVLLDCVMPQLGGFEAYAQMTAVRAGLPAIFCSGYSEELATGGTTMPPGARLLQKPYKLDTLLRTIGEALGRTAV